ncbi:hypothetical protein TA3x_004193 [Tundrisphaera sp. TA3]|uniref:hypothetical protein n=1 Tax=Tundrisphaera sp. TA3 TaxID=3435775 RepID=UPI003EBD9701
MSKWNHPMRSRALRPSAESLEGRQLLAASLTGINSAGDRWTLDLKGPGTLQVVKQDDASGNPGALDSATEIKSITISGTDSLKTKLIGRVDKSGVGDGRVFFQELNQSPNIDPLTSIPQGLLSIKMPDFYLGVTDPTVPSTATQPVAAINIPNGINSLRFGGVDATKFFGTDPAQGPALNGTSDQFRVTLGLPAQNGTRIVVNTVTSNGQAGTAGTSGATNPPTQDSVIFNVSGRINLFQADQINGNTAVAPEAAAFLGGTIVASLPDPTGAITGQIGFIRVGGDATNFTTFTNDKISDFYVGGETNNLTVLAPNGSRNLKFGRGLDTVSIFSSAIENLYANRGALSSRVVSDRMIGNLSIGGDVANSQFLSGYVQNLTSILSTATTNLTQPNFASAATIPTPTAQNRGQITAFIAGDITDSVFAASVQPYAQVIDPTDTTLTASDQDAFLPGGRILAKVEGVIDNTLATPERPNRAFYAQTVKLKNGPVSPPNVTERPFGQPTPSRLPGIRRLYRRG